MVQEEEGGRDREGRREGRERRERRKKEREYTLVVQRGISGR